MSQALSRIVTLSGEFSPNPVIAKGTDGTDVVFLHGIFGQEWHGYLDDLAESHRVFAPSNPGAEDPEDLRKIDNLFELILYYDELFDELGLETFDLVGHSYGGMVAAEFAAFFSSRVRRLVLIDSIGLWTDDSPVNDFITASPEKLRRQVWVDPSSATGESTGDSADQLATDQAAFVRRFGALASVAHFSFPIAEYGLGKRLRRITAPTLLIWGAEDGLVSPSYASLFQDGILNARVEIVPQAGHYPFVEQQEIVSKLTLDFLA